MRRYEHNMPPRVDTIKDNNVDYDNNSIPAMRQRIAELEEENEALKSENEVIAELEKDNKNLKQCLVEMQMPRGTMKTVTKKVVMFDTLKEEYQKLQVENAKLQERLEKERK